MGLVYEWYNLHTVALPFLLSLTAASAIALLLRRASERSGLPHAREPCVHCRHRAQLEREGFCVQACAVNALPTLPLALFIASTTFAILAAAFPEVVLTYVVPFNTADPSFPDAMLVFLMVVSTAVSLSLVAYFAQDLRVHRAIFREVAVATAIVGLLAGASFGGSVGIDAALLAPAALTALIFSIAIGRRSERDRPVLGLRSLALTTAPLFLVTTFALLRILEVLAHANAGG